MKKTTIYAIAFTILIILLTLISFSAISLGYSCDMEAEICSDNDLYVVSALFFLTCFFLYKVIMNIYKSEI